MGANTFEVTAQGATAQAAFTAAVSQARHEDGHGGYTGTIAEKSNFVTIDVPKGKDPREHARDLVDAGDPRIDDKWGPAGCIKLGPTTWLFFGWASS